MNLVGLLFYLISFLQACNSNKAVVPRWEKEKGEVSFSVLSDNNSSSTLTKANPSKKHTTQATILGVGYEASLYWAIPFTPRGDGAGLVQPDSGSQFILLDLAIKNTADKPLDVGALLLTAKLKDNRGWEYNSDPLIIAAFNLEYPYPGHKKQYNALKGILLPGEVCRTVALGFQAPLDTEAFVLQLENHHPPTGSRVSEASFLLK